MLNQSFTRQRMSYVSDCNELENLKMKYSLQLEGGSLCLNAYYIFWVDLSSLQAND